MSRRARIGIARGYSRHRSLARGIEPLESRRLMSVTAGTDALLSSAKGSPRTLVFTDAAGGRQTVSLNGGTADISFAAGETLTTKGSIITATGTPQDIASITLAGTTAKSSLSIHGPTKSPVTIGTITDASPLGSLTAPSAQLTGVASFAAVSDIQLLSMDNADLTTTGPAATPVAIDIPTGTASTVSTSQTIKSFTAKSWATDTTAAVASAVITAPVIDSLSIGGSFGGTVDANTSAGRLVFHGTLTGSVNAGAADLVKVVGDVTNGGISVGSAKSIVVTGTVSGHSTAFAGGDFALIDNAFNNQNGADFAYDGLGNGTGPAISSTGDVGAITVGHLSDAEVSVGVPSTLATSGGDYNYTVNTTLLNAQPSNLGTATLGSLRVTGGGTAGISGSSVLAGTIKSASVGFVTTTGSAAAQGLAADHVGNVSGQFAAGKLNLNAKELSDGSTLAAYLKSKGYSLGAFDIVLAG